MSHSRSARIGALALILASVSTPRCLARSTGSVTTTNNQYQLSFQFQNGAKGGSLPQGFILTQISKIGSPANYYAFLVDDLWSCRIWDTVTGGLVSNTPVTPSSASNYQLQLNQLSPSKITVSWSNLTSVTGVPSGATIAVTTTIEAKPGENLFSFDISLQFTPPFGSSRYSLYDVRFPRFAFGSSDGVNEQDLMILPISGGLSIQNPQFDGNWLVDAVSVSTLSC